MQQKKFAVIGHPIGHSMSPFIHQRLLKLAGVKGNYGILDIPPEELSSRFSDTLVKLDGFNVTIPHKQAILPLLNKVSGDAAAFGSVNTVALHGGKAIGYTTDGIGFTRALSAANLPLKGKVLLLGTGGVAHVLANEILRAPGVASLTVVMRRHAEEIPCPTDNASEVDRKLGIRLARENAFIGSLNKPIMTSFAARCPHGSVTVTDETSLETKCTEGNAHFDLLVNGTSSGMYPKLGSCPVSPAVVSQCGAVFDAIYNPGLTMLLKYAKAQKIPCAGGMGMLVWQAAAAEEIWQSCRFHAEEVSPIIHASSEAMRLRFGNIVLCGFMGCGKSTAGSILAKQLGRQFIDMDTYIEQQTGMTVSEIFAKKGESWFRKKEKEACQKLSRKSGLVLAAGGGALADPENAAVLRETGIIVLLDPPYEAIVQRLADDHSRPMLEKADRKAVMRRLYETRMPLYKAAADLTVSAADSTVAAQQIADFIPAS